ncbi:hypothetical protein [Paractinoplanes lichenicola]|uniref:Uncharacterized protein n=1 Tax=Paractinoplanes lichenicola TaxID=2802976 RepID=A0ABS1VJP6_9ACTN|nr:hypothetical protein [Actinoplanes lichenicola]MBL7254934.1 hypothetical protein [Actinoplanes lichenicola]
MRKNTKRSVAAVAAAVVAIGGGAAAWAAWTVSNSATASASAGSATPVGIVDAKLTGPLVPGPGTGVEFTVNNTNPFRVLVTGASLSGFATTQDGCDADNFVAIEDAAFNSFELEANAGTHTYTWNNSIKLKDNPDDACKGAPITFQVSVDAESLDS